MAMRWKKEPKETGLRSVGSSPRTSRLFIDGSDEVIACTGNTGFGWRGGDIKGWYWYCFNNSGLGIPHINTSTVILSTEKEAKDAARKYVLECIKNNK